MTEKNDGQESAPLEHKQKTKKKKDGKSKMKKTRRHFREETQRARAPQVPPMEEVKPAYNLDEPDVVESATSLSPSAIVEMFHVQERENTSSTSIAVTARYLVENETSGDFYHVRTRKRQQQVYLSDHTRHRRSSLVKAQQTIRDESNKAETFMWWKILQRDGEKAIVVMLLGVVTGMCWMDAMNRSRKNLFILFKYPSTL